MSERAAFIAELEAELDDEALVHQEMFEYHRDLAAVQLCAYSTERSREDLHVLLEVRGYLADQARWTSGFRVPGETVEQVVLPEMVERGDWERLVRYSLVALNLRGIAEALAEPEILRALVCSGRDELAFNVCLQLGDRLARAGAMAIAVGGMRGGLEAGSQLLRSRVEDLCRELDGCDPPEDAEAAGRRAEVLCTVADEVGDLVAARWPTWIGWLEPWPARADAVRMAAARSVSRVEGALADGVWCLVEAVTSPELLERGLVAVLDGCDGAQVTEAVARIGELHGELHRELYFGAESAWSIVIRLLDHQAARAPEVARQTWLQIRAGRLPLPRARWTVGLASSGARLWDVLEPDELGALLSSVDLPAARAAILVAVLELHPDPERLEQAIAAIEEVSEARDRVHLVLRAALCAGVQAVGWRAGVAELLDGWLRRAGYVVAAADLARYVDLVALQRPAELQRQIEYLLWSPAGTSEVLRALARECRSSQALTCLLTEAVSFAAAVAPNEAEGVELRRDLVVGLTARLIEAGADEQWVATALDRLAPDEEDALFAEVALAAARQGRSDLAARLVARIGSSRLRLIAGLRTSPSQSIDPALLEPAALYRAMAETRVVDDELQALGPLLELPTDPRDSARAILGSVASPERRALALLDLAEHALAYDERVKTPRQRDPTAALLPLREGLSIGVDDARALELIPALARAGSRLGVKQQAAELRQAVVQLLTSETVAWSVREALLDRVLAGLDEQCGLGRGPAAWRHAADLLLWLVGLPAGAPPRAAIDHRIAAGRSTSGGPGSVPEPLARLRARWHRVLPAVVAAIDRLQEWVWMYARHPVMARVLLEHLTPLLSWTSVESVLRLWTWLDHRLPARGLRRLVLGPRQGVGADDVMQCWPWLDERQRELVVACLQPPEARGELLRRAAEAGCQASDGAADEEGGWLRAASLLAVAVPQRVVELARDLDPGPERFALCHDLLRAGWIAGSAPEAEELLGLGDLVSAEAVEAELRVRAAASGEDRAGGDAAWARAVADGIARGIVDPLAGRHCETRWHLWEVGQRLELGPRLAAEVSRALAGGGRRAGESALRWWLQSHLRPVLGSERPEAGAELQRLQRAALASRSIDGTSPGSSTLASTAGDAGPGSGVGPETAAEPAPPGAGPAQEASAERSGGRLQRLVRSWQWCWNAGPGLELLGDPGRVAALIGIASIFMLQGVETFLWRAASGGSPAAEQRLSVPGWVALLTVVAVWFCSSMLVGSACEQLCRPRSVGRSRWGSLLLWFLCGVPVLGLAVPALAVPQLREPRKLTDLPEPCAPLSGPRVGAVGFTGVWRRARWLALRAMSRRGVVLTALGVSLIAAFAVLTLAPVLWHLTEEERLVGFVLAHGLVAATMAALLLERRYRAGRRLPFRWCLLALPLLWMVPSTVVQVVGVLMMAPAVVEAPAGELVARLGTTLTSGLRVRAWRALIDRAGKGRDGLTSGTRLWGSRPGRQAPTGGGEGWVEEHEVRRTRYLCLRCDLLLLEGWAFATVTSKIFRSVSGLGDVAERSLWLLVGVSVALSVLGLAMSSRRVAGWVLHHVGVSHTCAEIAPHLARFLMGSQLALAAGLAIGVHMAHGDAASAGGVLAAAGMALMAVRAIEMVMSSAPMTQRAGDRLSIELVLLVACAGSLSMVGFRLMEWPPGPHSISTMTDLPMVVSLSFLVSLMAGYRHLSMMVSPFPPDLWRSRTLPRAIRRPLRLMVITSVVPLGGVLAPVWIYLRRCRWPELVAMYQADRDHEAV